MAQCQRVVNGKFVSPTLLQSFDYCCCNNCHCEVCVCVHAVICRGLGDGGFRGSWWESDVQDLRKGERPCCLPDGRLYTRAFTVCNVSLEELGGAIEVNILHRQDSCPYLFNMSKMGPTWLCLLLFLQGTADPDRALIVARLVWVLNIVFLLSIYSFCSISTGI